MAGNTGNRVLTLSKDKLALEKHIKELEDMNLALTNENEILESKVKKWETMQEKGYTAVAINNDLIVHAVQVLPFSTFTYTQPIPEEIGTTLYSKFPFLELDSNGGICINTLQKIKHDSV